MAKRTTPRTLADFKAQHDPSVVIPNKIRAALAQLVKRGKENWVYEPELLQLAGITQPQLTTYRDGFEAHIVMTSTGGRSPKRVWFGDAKVARRFRGE
jgi:hypothetical protein